MSDCRDCRLVEENQKLQQEIQRLQEEIERLYKIIERLREVIDTACNYALSIYGQAAQVLGKRSGVPRGTWSFWKGSGEVARVVFNILSEGG